MSVIAFLLIPLLGLGAWNPTGPEGGEVKAVLQSTQNADHLFALSGSNPTQVVRSTDEGSSWSVISEFSGSTPYDLVMTASGKLVAVGSSRTWYSSDGGFSWSMVYMSNTIFWDACAHPSDGDRIFATGYWYNSSAWRFSFFESTDGGASWSTSVIQPSGTYSYGRCIAVSASDPDVLMAGGYYYNGSSNVPSLHLSEDGGGSWSNITPAAASGEYYFYGTAIDPLSPDTLLAGTIYSIYRSTDGGANWTKMQSQTYSFDISYSPVDTDLVLAGGSNRIYRSSNGGTSWSSVTSGLTGIDIKWIEPDRTDASVAFTGSSAGFFRSSDSGTTWEMNNTGLDVGKVLAMEYVDSGWIFMNIQDLGLWKSPASVTTVWEQVDTPLSCGDFCAIESNPALKILALEGGG